MTGQNFVLVVQMPNEMGEGHEFLVTHMDASKFDSRLWKNGKSDKLILALATMTQTAFGHFQAKVSYKTLLRAIRSEHDITGVIRKIELNFALPTQKDVVIATVRTQREDARKRVLALEERARGCIRLIASTKKRLEEYRTFLKQPDILSGIRAHYELCLIVDCEKALREVKTDLKNTNRKLFRERNEKKGLDEMNAVEAFGQSIVIDS
ncbi:MAG: hypothetical protein NTX72_04515 [Candidatus Uhrbacteria bacterium]|nr:hypothetical protein [Candidatus Uhrbacteria bacterium]